MDTLLTRKGRHGDGDLSCAVIYVYMFCVYLFQIPFVFIKGFSVLWETFLNYLIVLDLWTLSEDILLTIAQTLVHGQSSNTSSFPLHYNISL